jgi:PAS domain S-box-containing protein
VKTKLPETDERFRLLVENVLDYGIFILDPEGHVATWNAGAQRRTGYSSEEIIGRHFSHFYTPEDVSKSIPRYHLHCAQVKEQFREEGWRLHKDGSRFWASVAISGINNSEGELVGYAHVVCGSAPGRITKLHNEDARTPSDNVTDASETPKDAQEGTRIRRMEAEKTAAEKANKAKDEFLAVLSHELRTPLTPALAAASYLADHAENLPQEFREEIATIRRNIQLEARLIDDLLDLTRIVRGKIELHFEVVDAHRVLREIIEVVGDDIIEKELDVGISLSAQAHLIWADPVRIRQVYWNLIRNAVKFTPPRGHIDIRSSNDEQARFHLEVSDSGVGIEPERQSGVFNAFEQGSTFITREFGGLGLGLTISKKLIDLHGGTIAVESAGKDRGASFKITLESLREKEMPNEQSSENGAAAPKSLRLLLVEDHADTRRTLSRLLSRCGHKVSSTDHVESALKLLDSKRFDALVSDIQLPGRSGYELIAIAKQRHHLKGIAISGFGMEEDIKRSLAAGFDHHLTKPVDFRNLSALLNKIST